MERSCPHCGGSDLEGAAQGRVLRCRGCGRSALQAVVERTVDRIDAPGGGVEAGPASGLVGALVPSGGRRRRAGPGEVAMLPVAGVALLATLVFYGVLRLVPDARIAQLFLARGWVPYAIAFVSSWALALLAAKRLRLARERRLLAQDWLAGPNGGGSIQPGDVDRTLAGLASRADFDLDALLARRLVRALRHFQARRRVVEVVEFLSDESRADEGRIDASYGLIRVFIWAVPTLGFIGTVIGIGAAVGGFSNTLETASSLEGMRESIGTVTGGLGVAFDTTLLALVMSILIMFPSNALQRLEEGFLGEVDDYCAEHLVRRLVDEPPAAASDAALDRLAERLLILLRSREASGA
ncbi:MAG: MotA/TolQ/ExbB proton channel family protein [Myxococcota bacterium]